MCRVAMQQSSQAEACLLREFRRLLANNSSQRSIYSFRVGEDFGDIRLQDGDILSLREATRIFFALAG